MKKLSLRCISVIMALLFAFAPLSSAFAIKIPGLVTYPTEKKIAETLGGYLKARDVDGIVGMFSEASKNKIENLKIKVKKLLDEIDCDIVEYKWRGSGGSDKSNYGYYHKTCSFHILIRTEDKVYDVIATYVQAWTDDKSYEGLDSLILILEDVDEMVVDYLSFIDRPGTLELNYKGAYRYLKESAKIRYAELGYKKIVCESSDESVAVIDEDAVITAKGRGTALVTIKYVNEDTGRSIERSCNVTVTFTTWQKIIWFLFFGFLWY